MNTDEQRCPKGLVAAKALLSVTRGLARQFVPKGIPQAYWQASPLRRFPPLKELARGNPATGCKAAKRRSCVAPEPSAL